MRKGSLRILLERATAIRLIRIVTEQRRSISLPFGVGVGALHVGLLQPAD
jgi:hypothetical protein